MAKTRVIFRFANSEERANPDIKKYKDNMGRELVREEVNLESEEKDEKT